MKTEELKRLAEAATPGQWAHGVTWIEHLGGIVALGNTARSKQDVAYVAAANPAAILELIQQRDELLEELEKERKRLDWVMKKQAYYGRSPDRLWVDVGTGNHKWFAVYDDNPRATIDELMVK